MNPAPTPHRPQSRQGLRFALTIAALLGTGTGRLAAQAPDAEQVKFFETEVRPLLAANCVKCHGPEKQKGGLRLDSKAGLLAGGESGPAVVPGKTEESLLVEAIRYEGLEMPPSGKLDEPQREALTRWVEMGAPWPGASGPAPPRSAQRTFTADERAFWSFQPLRRPEPPAAADGGWARNPIDRFIFARLAREGLSPSPEADRTTLIRRLTFDLWGLPPAPDAVDAFVKDESPDAYERLVDRLLAGPRYGERWARYWLDLVRYAESDGYRQDAYRPDAWRYRDYVVKAFNEDRPYDRFVTEQLAGDELDPADPEMRVAAGFYRLGTYEYNQRDVPGQWAAVLNDVTDVAGDVFLGLGMGCARCHDHKFDPILQRDYYRLQAFFAPIRPRDDLPLATPAQQARYEAKLASWQTATAELRAQIEALERPYRAKVARDAIAKFPAETQAVIAKPPAERSPLEQQLYELAYRQISFEYDQIGAAMKKKPDGAAWEALQKRLAESDRDRPAALPKVLTVTDIGPVAPPLVIPGDRTKQPIEPGFLTMLDPAPATVAPLPAVPDSTGRRTALARWLTRPDHPLTTRVAVNRLWQYHFGRGLVGTSSDFGRLGERPSHPELLDWLATEFVGRGWGLKAIHRLVLTSATYRQSAANPAPETARKLDPENRLLWRSSTRRLDLEPIRDALLAVSGELQATIGGPSADAAQPRRTIDTKVIRNTRDPLNEAFDAPDGSISTPQRLATVTPIQALLMINGPWSLARARAFAGRLRAAAPDDPARIELAYRLAFGRSPDASEQADALAFLGDQARRSSGTDGPPADSALIDFCHALFNTNEFLYVD